MLGAGVLVGLTAVLGVGECQGGALLLLGEVAGREEGKRALAAAAVAGQLRNVAQVRREGREGREGEVTAGRRCLLARNLGVVINRSKACGLEGPCSCIMSITVYSVLGLCIWFRV
jgi:hypothetical protein